MGRYQPTAEEQAAIDLLTLAGYAVVRQRTYDELREQVTLAKHREGWLEEDAAHARAWAHESLSGERRLADRLNQVCTAAASLGVPIDKINRALGRTQPESVKAKIHQAIEDVRWRVMMHEERADERSPYMVPSDAAQRVFVEMLQDLERKS